MTVYRQKFRSNSSEIRLECGALCRCIGRYPTVRVHKYAPCCGAQISLISFTRFRRRRRTSAAVGYRRHYSSTTVGSQPASILFSTLLYFIIFPSYLEPLPTSLRMGGDGSSAIAIRFLLRGVTTLNNYGFNESISSSPST